MFTQVIRHNRLKTHALRSQLFQVIPFTPCGKGRGFSRRGSNQ